MKNLKKFGALLLALVMVLSLSVAAFAAGGEGTIEPITEVGVVEGNNIVVSGSSLQWYPADETVGRYSDGWWVGVKITAPTDYAEAKAAMYSSDGGANWKSFNTNKDGEWYITCWLPVQPEYIEGALNANSRLIWKYQFDWDTTDGTYSADQTFTITVDPGDITLTQGGKTTFQTKGGNIVVKDGAPVASPANTYGAAEIITGKGDSGNFVTGNNTNYTVVTLSALDLDFSSADEAIGRNQDACWAGIWMHAPEGYESGAKYQTWGAEDWSVAKDWAPDSGTSMQLWVPVTAETLTAFYRDGYDLRWFYNLDWNGDGTYEQMLEIKVVPNPAVVIHDENNAVAWSIDTTSYEYTIQIDNAVAGETYKAYKIFDVTYADTSNDGTIGEGDAFAYSISNTNPWYETVKTFAEKEGSKMKLTASANDATVFIVETEEGFSAADFAAALNAAGKTGKPVAAAAVATAASVEMKVEEAGYYFVDTSLGSLCSLDTTTPTVTIYEKNTKPSITKQVQEDSTAAYGDYATADVIDTVNYKLTVNTGTKNETITPDGTGVDADYVIVDTLPAGFTAKAASVKIGHKVTVEGTETAQAWTNADYTAKWDDAANALVINLKSAKLATVAANTDIEITYSATIDAAKANIEPVGDTTGNKNNVTLTYKAQESKADAVVYTYQIGGTTADNKPIIQKVDATNPDNKTPLAGVKFILSKTETVDSNEVVKYATVVDGVLTGWTTDKPAAGNIVSGNDGGIIVKGLDAGTYILTEVETLPGYNMLTDTITVEIKETVNTDGTSKVDITYKMTNGKNADGTDAAAANTISIENKTGTELPSTGGIGTTIFYVVGTILVLGAAILLITRRRMNAAK